MIVVEGGLKIGGGWRNIVVNSHLGHVYLPREIDMICTVRTRPHDL